jgi:hypothetical protein
MQIAEMRSALEADYAKGRTGQFPNAPDWVVRGIYERRNGLPLTPVSQSLWSKALAFWTGLGADLRKQLRSMQNAETNPGADAVTDSDREAVQRRVRARQLASLK